MFIIKLEEKSQKKSFKALPVKNSSQKTDRGKERARALGLTLM